MSASVLGVAPTIICVLCPPGAKRGGRRPVCVRSLEASMLVLIVVIAESMSSIFFCGASVFRSAGVGSSIFALSRSA
jgi:hypothetical protein